MRISIFAAIAASLVATAASAVPFDISNGGYTLGSGFGCPTSNQNQSLCLTTNYTLGDPAAFNLTALGQSTSLTVGTVTLADDDANFRVVRPTTSTSRRSSTSLRRWPEP